MLPRKHALARFPRMEGVSRSSYPIKNLKRTLFPTVDCYDCEFDEFLRAFFKAIESCRLRVDLE